MNTYTVDEYQGTSAAGFTKRMIHQSAAALVFVLNFEPGQTLPAHSHQESDIFVTVLKGQGQAIVDGKTYELRSSTAVRCEGKETFSVQNSSTGPLSLLVFLYPGNPHFAGNVR